MLTSRGPGDAARRRGGDRRRDPRAGRHQAGRPPRRSRSSGSSALVRARPPQRIGLSATQRPLDEIARFLGGFGDRPAPRRSPSSTPACASRSTSRSSSRSRTWARSARSSTSRPAGPAARRPGPAQHLAGDAPAAARADRSSTARRSSSSTPAGWPSGWPPGSTSWPSRARRRRRPRPVGRRSAPPAGVELVKAHHGSLSPGAAAADRGRAQGGPAQGPGRHVVARARHRHGRGRPRRSRSSRPASVARGLQRIGRAGHQVGEPSRGKLFPKHRGRPGRGGGRRRSACSDGLIEETRYPRNPLDVLAQQIVAMCALDEWTVDELAALVRRAANFAELSDEVLAARARPAGRPLPVRGVRRAAAPHRVGPGAAASCGAGPGPSAWRSPAAAPSPTAACSACSSPTAPGSASSTRRWSTRAGRARRSCSARPRGASRTSPTTGWSSPRRPGQPGKMPFWHGDGPGRPLELGRAVGAFVRELRPAPGRRRSTACATDHGLDERAAANLVALPRRAGRGHRARCPTTARSSSSGSATRSATGGCACSSPFGAQVHAPWAMALAGPAGRAAGASTSS